MKKNQNGWCSLSLVIIIILEQIPLPLRGLGVGEVGSSLIAVVLILYFYVQPSCWERVDLRPCSASDPHQFVTSGEKSVPISESTSVLNTAYMLIRSNGWIQTVCISSSSAIWFIQRGGIYPDNGLFDSKEFKLMDFYENLNCPLLMFDSITVMILKEKCYQFLTIWYACNFTN